MATLIPIGAPVNDAERTLLKHLQDHAPRSWKVLHNFELPRDGEWYEIDAAVLTPHAVYLVDAKGTAGRVEVEGSRWYPEGRSSFHSPLAKLRGNVRAFKGLLEHLHPGNAYIKDLYVAAAVVLTAPDARLIDPERRDQPDVVELRRSVAFFQDLGRVPARFSHSITPLLGLVETAIRGRSRARQDTRFGNWIATERLGGTDQVSEFRGRNATTGSSSGTVLLRVFRADSYLPEAERTEQRRRIGNAFVALLRLPPHPGIVAARDFFPWDDDQRYVLVTEDFAGQPLHLHLRRPDLILTLDQKLEVATGLLQALAHAHVHGVTHRAISPLNILRGRDGRVCLTGFEFARTGTDRSYTVVGTLLEHLDRDWIAPEGLSRPQALDQASDIYSAGLVLYTLLAGERPFHTPTEQVEREGRFPAPASARRPDLPAGLDAWLQDLCAWTPADRPSAEVALARLRALVEGMRGAPPPAAPKVEDVLWDNLPKGHALNRKYKIEARLGKPGSYGVVYRAFDTLNLETRALKLILRDRVSKADRLEHEYRRLRALPPHPNIVRVIDADFLVVHGPEGRDREIPMLVFEFVDGLDVSEMIDERMFSPEDVLALGRDVASALVHMHQQHIFHCDIKPSNLLWTGSGVKVLDFNVAVDTRAGLSHGGGTPRYLPPDYDREVEPSEAQLGDRDLFALGVTLYQALTGQYPWGDASVPIPGTPARDPRDLSGFSDLSPQLAGVLAQALAPRRGDRFGSAEELARAMQAVSSVRVARAPTPPASAPDHTSLRPNYNPYIDSLLTLYSQSRRSNAGTRGLDRSDAHLYVETLLDRELRPELLEGRYRLVLITGNAGDGKTAFLETTARKALDMGAQDWSPIPNGVRFALRGRRFLANHDGSQDEEGTPNEAVLEAFFAPFADNEVWPEDETRLIAINEGRLVDFLSSRAARFNRLTGLVQRGLLTGAPEGGVAVINLNLRSVVADPQGKDQAILERLLARLVAEPFWEPCQSCDLKDRCYALHNARTFQDVHAGPRAAKRLGTLYALTHLRGRQHITLRDLRSALAYMLVGTRDCDEIHALYEAGDPTVILEGFYFNSWMGGTSPSNDRLLQVLKEVDPGQGTDPRGDRRLDFTSPTADGTLQSFAGRGNYDQDLLQRWFGDLPRGWGAGAGQDRLMAHRRYLSSVRRRAWFELRSDDRWRAMVPYRAAWRLQDIIEGRTPLDEALDLVIEAINRGEGLSDLSRLDGALALQVRQVAGGTIGSYRLFPRDRLRLQVLDEASRARFVEHSPDGLLLIYQGERGERATLRINLDVFEMLVRLAEGYRPTVEELQGYYLSLGVFKNLLASVPYQEVLLTVTGHDFHRIRREGTGRLVLERLEVR